MPDMSPPANADVVSLDAARLRRHYIDLANAHPTWLEIKASWALEGIELVDDNAVNAGRMIAGDITYAQFIDELSIKHGRQTLSTRPTSGAIYSVASRQTSSNPSEVKLPTTN